MNARFLVFADLHADMIHDAASRVEIIAKAAREQNVDFVIQLGDIQYPETDFLQEHSPQSIPLLIETRPWSLNRDDEKMAIRAMLSGIGKPLYSVLGNHDLHVCDKETMCIYWGIPAPFYFFCTMGIRFLVLDTNFIRTQTGTIDIAYGNSDHYADHQLRYLSEEQLDWLHCSIMTSAEPCVLLSHVSLVDRLSGIHDQAPLRSILQNAGDRKVILGLNGHGHIDGLTCEYGIPFVDINSASYHYVGESYRSIRYSERLCQMYPRLAYTAPYYDPLYAIVTISDTEISVKGVNSSFVGLTPKQLNLPDEENDYPPCACISDRFISLK